MTFRDLVAQLLERGNALQTFWGFYISISLGLVAFLVNTKSVGRLPRFAGLLTIGFVAFATVNCGGMIDIAHQRRFFYEQIRTGTYSDSGIGRVSAERLAREFLRLDAPPEPEYVRGFHILADVVVLAAMWAVVGWRKNEVP
jgi:hypothetical protein